MSNESVLPREIFLQILDILVREHDVAWSVYLNSDPLTPKRCLVEKSRLLSLSTVCRYFRNYLLPSIFRSFLFYGPHHLSTNLHTHRLTQVGYRTFAKHLVDQSPRAIELASLVKECVFSGWHSVIIAERSELYPCSELYLHSLAHMPNLTTLRFPSALANFATIAPIIRDHTQLSHLEIGHVGMLSMNFPTTIDRSGIPEFVSALLSSHISTLTLDALSLSGLAAMYQTWSAPFTSLRTLRVKAFTGDVEEFFGLLPHLSSLVALHIEMYWHRVAIVNVPDVPASANPYLETLACPVHWAQYFLPRRPLRRVELRHPVYSESPETLSLTEVVSALARTSRPVEYLLVPHQIALADWRAVDLTGLETLMVDTDEFSFGSFVGTESGALESYRQIREQFCATVGSNSTAFSRLSEFTMLLIHRQLDLPYQWAFLNALAPSFPSLTHARLSSYLWWKKEGSEWKPKLSDDNLAISIVDGGKRFAEQRDHRKEHVVDFRGYFESLGVFQPMY